MKSALALPQSISFYQKNELGLWLEIEKFDFFLSAFMLFYMTSSLKMLCNARRLKESSLHNYRLISSIAVGNLLIAVYNLKI